MDNGRRMVASTTKPSTTDKTNAKAPNKAEPYEVTVRVANCPEATRRRSSHDTIQRANSVLGNNTVIAARTLPSGDVRLTFAAAAASSQIDEAWLLHVFGTGATRLRTEHAVIVRGVPPAVINPDFDIHGVAAQNSISFQRVIPARARPGATKRSFILIPHVIVGDFNAHHLSWDFFGRETRDSSDLIAAAGQARLVLVTPPGIFTWEPPDDRHESSRPSTIDLVWASPSLQPRHVPAPRDLHGSDYILQLTYIQHTRTPSPAPTWRWCEADPDTIRALGATLIITPEVPTDSAAIDRALTDLHNQLEEIASATVLSRIPGSTAQPPWWSSVVYDAVISARRARRHRHDSDAAKERYRDAVRDRNRAIRQAKTAAWRRFVDELSHGSSALWRLAEWGAKPPDAKYQSRAVPPLDRDGASPATSIEEKAAVFAAKFSPPAPNLLPSGPWRGPRCALKGLADSIDDEGRALAISLMQLDIAGAFDAMPHECLLKILVHLGADPAALNLIGSFLDDRSTYLVIDGVSTGPFRLRFGSPQGSSISPILFIIYILTLYHHLSNIPSIQLIGFSDDSNIVAIAPTHAGVVRLLEEAWTRCASWADAHGATFAAAKTTITHFTRAHSPLTTSVRLGPVSQPPTETARFLGFYFYRKLTWEYHAREAKTRAARAAGALSGTGGIAWGTRLENARLIYTMVHCSILTYGSVLFHKPGDIPLGPARTMSSTQHDMPRLLAGAFRATPAHYLEAELQIPPLHLYMTYRSERSLARFKNNETLARVRAASATVAGLQRLPRRQHYRRRRLPPSVQSRPSRGRTGPRSQIPLQAPGQALAAALAAPGVRTALPPEQRTRPPTVELLRAPASAPHWPPVGALLGREHAETHLLLGAADEDWKD
ncbi:hypothetical protein VHEMI09241 [[Torrubiella] hemipterigena]|uniref:Reverse transcriptase domain-containing protein n=1 Tax=[Torrubiella] hemipterigena TaxID=1531966 RepID=A0A0A1TPR4_9HYPO|nr:hypothetical protein VHEMI09241 [[Torrubiella] hemipterigena]